MPEFRTRHLGFLKANLRGYVCDYVLAAAERTLAEYGVPGTDNHFIRPIETLGKVFMKLGLIRNLYRSRRKAFIVCMLDVGEFRLFPPGYLYESILYCMDCWQPKWPLWEKFLRRNRIRLAFFTARASAEHFAGAIPEMQSLWLPEALDPAEYKWDRPLTQRSIHVLELGRQYTAFHNQIVGPLHDCGRRHLYARTRFEKVFEDQPALVDGYNDTMISVCFPRSVTHPAESGNVETMTLRYLEGLASKCIVLGTCPKEMSDLFGYNPIVDVDPSDPAGQIEEILRDPDRYQLLVEKNYQRLLEVGTWKLRVRQIFEHAQAAGYGAEDAFTWSGERLPQPTHTPALSRQ